MSRDKAPLALLPDAADRYARRMRLSAALWLATAAVIGVLLISVSMMASRIAALEARLDGPEPVGTSQYTNVTVPWRRPSCPPRSAEGDTNRALGQLWSCCATRSRWRIVTGANP